MTTSFRPKFPAGAIKNLRAYTLQEKLSPADWAKRETASLRSGDIVVCFNPAGIGDGARTELEPAALLLVQSGSEQGEAQGILVTDDFYVTGAAEAVFRERALAAAARQTIFSFVTVPYTAALSEDSRRFLSGMQRWGSGGTRANPMHGLPDPLAAFFACLGATLPPGQVVSVGHMAAALIRRNSVAGLPDMSSRYAAVMAVDATPKPEKSISSVTIVENAAAPDAGSARSASGLDSGLEEGAAGDPSASTSSGKADAAAGSVVKAEANQSAKTPILPPLPSGQSQSRLDGSAAASGYKSGSGESGADSGFLSIRKRLEARLSGRLPKSSGLSPADSSSLGRIESSSPVVKLVSNIRQQMSVASDNLEYRVSTLKSKMLDRLVSCKHNLGEQEQANLRALEDLRIQMQMKLETSAAQAKEELTRVSVQGVGQVRNFQVKASTKLAELLAQQELYINDKCENAKKAVADAVNGTRADLDQTVSRAQHSLRSVVTTTEVNLNQVLSVASESMDERINGFRLQTQIMAEGIGLSVESMSEAAKLQAHQSEDEVVKRLEALSEEALKSLREQSVRAEMECAKLIDKLAREKLVPNLQDKRKMVMELAAFFHEEFSGAIQELLENRLAEFEPIVRSNLDANASALQDFTSRWTQSLEQHQRDLDESEAKLREKVDECLASAKSRIDSIQDISKVTEQVLSSPELIRTRDETCLRFDILSREQVAKAYAVSGDRIQAYKQESLDHLTELREDREAMIKAKGEESRSKIRNKLRAAMQRIQDLQSKYTA